jgi:hypothetical protein
VAGAKMEILAAHRTLLTGGVPAPLKCAFLEVKVRIAAGAKPVSFPASGKAVGLDTPAGRLVPLGLAADEPATRRPARAGTVSVAPGQAAVETLVFLVPTNLTRGALAIAGLRRAALPAVPIPPPPPPDAIVGTWEEAGRYLKAAYDDPLADRLRAAPKHRLLISGQQGQFAISLPPTGFTGWSRLKDDGTYSAVLESGMMGLECCLCLAGHGKCLVLHLAEGFDHQIVYEKR